MWVLLLIMINAQTGHETPYKLNEFPLKELCVVEGQRIATEMATAYPGETDFRIECHQRRKT
jgi:hypothetical protein